MKILSFDPVYGEDPPSGNDGESFQYGFDLPEDGEDRIEIRRFKIVWIECDVPDAVWIECAT